MNRREANQGFRCAWKKSHIAFIAFSWCSASKPWPWPFKASNSHHVHREQRENGTAVAPLKFALLHGLSPSGGGEMVLR